MPVNSNALLRYSFLFGALVGGTLILTSLLFYFKGVSVAGNSQIVSINYFLIITGIYFGLRMCRNEILGGRVSYGKALGLGVLIIGIAGLFYAVYTYVLVKYFDPSVLQEFIHFMEKALIEGGYSDDQIDFLMSVYEKTTPEAFAFAQWFSKLGAGFLFSLILAFFFSRNNGTMGNNLNNKTQD